jgi:hypothetical protein
MGPYDINPATPGLLRVESLNISLKFDRTSPTAGRVSWNIPTPATGCGAGTQAYNGIVVTIDTTPTAVSKVPVTGMTYTSDPTADANLHVGDKIGTALVIGSFYNDLTTVFFDVSGLTPNTPYYVTGYPVDAQYRYFIEGVHSYSLDYDVDGSVGTTGSQIVIIHPSDNSSQVQPTDFTELMPGITYQFQITVGLIPRPRTPQDPIYGVPVPVPHTISVSGTYASTYTDLINEINKQLSLIDNPSQGPYAPNTGAFYWNATLDKLYQWNGSMNVELPVIIQDTSPAVVLAGTYWLNPTTFVLKRYNGAAWVAPEVITSTVDPQNPIADTTYWFDGTIGHLWNGTTWCDVSTILSATDPSTVVPTTAGAFWYNTTTEVLYKWDNIFEMWVIVDEIKYSVDPNSLTTGAYWFDESSNTLNAWNTPTVGVWNQQANVSVSEHQPTTPADGKFWYDPTTQILKQYVAITDTWTILEVISYPTNPITRHSCDLWWNTTLNQLNVWDIVNSIWKPVATFYRQDSDPSLMPILSEGSLWYNNTTDVLYAWKNNCFKLVQFISRATDPTIIAVDVIWYNPTTDVWKVNDGLQLWTIITPIISENDPAALPAGTYWYDTINNAVKMWNGVAWVSLLFATSSPGPALNSTWFNTTMSKLLVWNGTAWEIAPVRATVEMTSLGYLLFTDTQVGSSSLIQILDINLFQSLAVAVSYNDPKPGSDAVSSKPSYEEVGIGTDGTDDQRLKLMNEIRFELGYPSVDVELTPEQLDYAITKALGELRERSGLPYKRAFLFMQVNPETQRYILSNKIGGFDKVVQIMGIYRLTSSFLSSAHGAGLYGQIVLQQLYNMGTFDLLSYHIMTEYTKTMEQLFAAKLTFTFNEQTRELWIHHRFPVTEPYVTMECSMERTEQEILSDRLARPWLRRYALATSRLMLAEIRGKFASLPGASGSISLNASDLRMAAKEDFEICNHEIDDFVVNNVEEWGMASTFTFG